MEVAEKERMPRLSLGEEKNMVTQLLLLNITVYILLYFIKIIYQMEEYGLPAFERDIMTNTLVSASPMTLLTKPWTILTAMFTHVAFWDIFSNMVWLFCFGSLLQNQNGVRLVVPLYLFGSIAGYAFYITGMNLIPAFQPQAATATIMGAGAGTMAMAAGVTTLAPTSRVFPMLIRGGIPVWIISLIYLALNLTAIYTSNGSHTSLLYLAGGAFMGFMVTAQFKKGHNWGGPINRLMFSMSHLFHSKAAKEALREDFPDQEKQARKTTPIPYARVGNISEHKVNEILDKINEQGFNSLSAEEKETLLRASKEQDAGN